MKISIKTIPHELQRYDTCGDWVWTDAGDLEITVSSTNNWKYEALVAVHELIEVLLCHDRGISQQVVDDFDMSYERDREEFGYEDEPGNEKDAPYHKEHKVATKVEKILAKELKVNWKEYDDHLNNL